MTDNVREPMSNEQFLSGLLSLASNRYERVIAKYLARVSYRNADDDARQDCSDMLRADMGVLPDD